MVLAESVGHSWVASSQVVGGAINECKMAAAVAAAAVALVEVSVGQQGGRPAALARGMVPLPWCCL